MRLFHITSNRNAVAILKEGFRNGTGDYSTKMTGMRRITHYGQEWTGVWVSDEPFDSQFMDDANTLLTIEISEGVISEFEWVEEGKSIREWLVPAALLNSYGPPIDVTDDYYEEYDEEEYEEEGYNGEYQVGFQNTDGRMKDWVVVVIAIVIILTVIRGVGPFIEWLNEPPDPRDIDGRTFD